MATRLVIEPTRTALRLALAESRAGGWAARSFQTLPLGEVSGTAEALRARLKQARGISQVIAVVPREQVITRIVKFPAEESGELAQMVELYAKAQLPYPREQSVVDFHVVSRQGGFSTVAIVAAQRDVVDRIVALLREAGLTPDAVTVSSWGVFGWSRSLASKELGAEPRLLINIDDARTDLVLMAEGRLVVSRSVGQGLHDWTNPDEIPELLAQEVDRSRAAIRKELPEVEIRSLALTGLGAVAQWAAQLSQRLSLPVSAIDPHRPFPRAQGATGGTFSPVVIGGVAQSDLEGLLNLAPPEARVHLHHRAQVRELVTAGALLLGVLMLGASVMAVEASRHQRMAKQLDRALVQVEPAAKAAQEKTRVAELVRSLLEDRRRLATAIGGIFQATPDGVALEALAFDHARDEITVRGSAGSTQQVLEYLKALERVEGIRDAGLKYTARRATADGELTDFEMALRYERPSG